MELEFAKEQIACLRPVVSQILSQEQTQEAVVPDSGPDVGRVVGCWGTPFVRSTQWRERGMSLTGGVAARALYVPAEGGTPVVMEAWLPFVMNWDFAPGEGEGRMRFDLRLRSADARMITPRKLLFRVNLAARGEAFENGEATFHTPQDPPKDVALKRTQYPLVLPTELSQKQFPVDEELELPGACPAAQKIVDFRIQPEVTDKKVLGAKGVFKGQMLVHVLYLTPEGRLSSWDFDLPFSHYGDLDRSYDQEEELQVTLLPMDMELEMDDTGRRLRLRGNFTAQCMVLCRQTRELIEDAYSPRRTVSLQTAPLTVDTRLDRQFVRETGTASFSVSGSLADCGVWPDYPRANRNGDQVELETPVYAQVLYYDETGELQGRTTHTRTATSTALAENCRCNADSCSLGRPQWSSGGGTAELRFNLGLTADCYPKEPMSAVTGLDLGELQQPDPGRPSVIIRRPGEATSLWDIAKNTGSTVEAIRSANGMDTDFADPDRLLLIPVV